MQEDLGEKTLAAASSKNIFDDLPALKEPETTATELQDELANYLSTPRDLSVKDGLRWTGAGGMTENIFTPAFTEWQWTTYQFPVGFCVYDRLLSTY